MDYTIEMIARDIAKITIGVNNYDVALTPVIIDHDSYAESDADIAISPSVTAVDNVYTLDEVADTEYEITFNADGVYKLYITENDIDYLHIIIIANTVDDYFEDKIPDFLSTTPLSEDDSNREYYDFNVITVLTINFFGETNQNIYLNYEDITSGILYEGNIYQCNSSGAGTFDWQDSSNEDLLMNMNGSAVTSNNPLVVDTYYKCIKTGTPTNWGSETPTEITLYSDYFDTWIKRVVDSLYKFSIYNQTNIDN
ncbi:MAG: hypothetical protein WC917_04545 [Bacilli bacterium]|jgi:hypothetical protein